MRNMSFERQLRDASAPSPDPRARVEARRAALAEFQRLHPAQPAAPAPRARVRTNGLWSGLLAAGVAVVGLSIFWMMPEEQRYPTPLAPVAQQPAVPAPADTAATRSGPAPASALVEPEIAAAPPVGQQENPRAVSPAPPPLLAAAPRPLVSPASPSALPLVAGGSPVPQNLVAPESVVGLAEEGVTGLRIADAADTNPQLMTVNGGGRMQAAVTSSPEALNRGSEFIANTIAGLRGMDPTFGARTLTLVNGSRTVSLIPAPGRDRFQHFEVNPVKRAADEPVSTFSIDVDTASYSFARRQINQGVLPPAESIRSEEMINYFDYDWPASTSRQRPFRPTVTVSDSPWNAGRKLVHIGIRGYEMPARTRPDVNLVLLLDVSGSMNSPDRLPLAQRSMGLLLDSLKPTDTVAIAVYSGAAGEVLAPTPVREKEKILHALDSLRPGGSTAGAAGIRLAYQLARRSFREDGVNRILLATDGDFNVGISDTAELKRLVERERESGVFLSVLGFGQGNYRDEMAQVLAQNGNGVAAYIDTLAEARKVLVEQAGAALFTIASDVKLQVEFNPATVAEYRLVGYETRGLNREDFNNDRVDAGDVGAGHTVTAIYEITPVGARQLVDERRYGPRSDATPARARGNEYGFVKIRYKLPGRSESELLEQPIAVDAGVPRGLRQDVRFATAVAGFAQLLQGGRYTGTLTFEDVLGEAEASLGADPHRYRAEFLELVRRARDIARAE